MAALSGAPTFKQAMAGVPNDVIALRYEDSKGVYNNLYTSLQQYWSMAVMMAAQQGLALPRSLPKIDHIIAHATPACSYSVYEDGGLRVHSEGASSELGLAAGFAVAAGTAAVTIIEEMQSEAPVEEDASEVEAD